jgi:sporulation integral membrane protein YlbJ
MDKTGGMAVKKLISVIAALGALALMLLCPADALEGARYGLALCAQVIVPSLLPFFVATSLLNALGLPEYLGRRLTPAMNRLFGVSGAGCAAFILGITGGYPLGAAAIADMRARGAVGRDEAENLLGFCNNSGPAFIIGAAGVGVFSSSAAGLLLYFSHAAAALMTGVLLSRPAAEPPAPGPVHTGAVSLSRALPEAVKKSVAAVLGVCGFVVTFTVLVGLLDSQGAFSSVTGAAAAATGLELHFVRALLTGLLELGSGIGAMQGLALTPGNLALASFILGWGGVSVHFQTMAAIADTDIKGVRHLAGRLMSGCISAAISFLLGGLLL